MKKSKYLVCCNRCGEYALDDDMNTMTYNNRFVIRLCPSCSKKFREFMDDYFEEGDAPKFSELSD